MASNRAGIREGEEPGRREGAGDGGTQRERSGRLNLPATGSRQETEICATVCVCVCVSTSLGWEQDRTFPPSPKAMAAQGKTRFQCKPTTSWQ